MANLQLNIEVNDEDFKTLCTNNINSLPQDKLEEILLKAVEVALIRDKNSPSYNTDANILVNKVDVNNGWSTTYKYEPTALLNEIIKKVDLTPYIGTLADSIKHYIEQNYEEIIKKYVIEQFAKMLFGDDKKYELRNTIINDVSGMLERHKNW